MNTALVVPQERRREQFVAEATERTNELEAQVNRISQAIKDAVADTRSLRVDAIAESRRGEVAPVNRVRIVAPQGLAIGIADAAHDQLAEKLGIPKTYYRRMLDTQPELLAQNMNTWFGREPEKRLLRMLEPITEQDARNLAESESNLKLRAFLGASYRPLDNAELLQTVLPVMRQHGAFLREFSLDDQRLHARFARFEQDVQSVIAKHAEIQGVGLDQVRQHAVVNGRDVSWWVNEVMRLGAYLRNSETGFASLDVAGFMEILKCLNGMIVPAQVKVRHIGGKRGVDEGELRFLSEQTQRLDNAAIFSRVKDALVASLDETKAFEIASTLHAAKTEQIVGVEENLFEFVGNVGRTMDLTDKEIDVLKEETSFAVQQERSEVGFVNKFAIVQGITALARRSEDFDRRTELERTGWTFLTGSTKALLDAGKEVKARARRN